MILITAQPYKAVACLTNHTGSIPRQIMPLVINSLGSGHTDTQTHMHAYTHTHHGQINF